jgi:hypothetical protein
MTQYPGGQPPYDPNYGRPPDPYSSPQAYSPPQAYAPPPQPAPPSDPYYGQQPPADPYYGQQPAQPTDPYYGQAPATDPYYGQSQDPYAQQAAYQAWQAQQQAWWQAQQPPPPTARSRGGAGAAVAGIFLVLLGAWFLFRDQISVDLGQTWPVIAVALGIVMVIAAFIPRRT